MTAKEAKNADPGTGPIKSMAARPGNDMTAPGSPACACATEDQASAAVPVLDRAVKAQMAKVTGGLSPAALAGAYLDWATHLAISPGKQVQLWESC